MPLRRSLAHLLSLDHVDLQLERRRDLRVGDVRDMRAERLDGVALGVRKTQPVRSHVEVELFLRALNDLRHASGFSSDSAPQHKAQQRNTA